jgi:hypothetical protein
MIWFTLLLFAASFFLSVLLTPKPNIENARPGKLGDIRFPRNDEGSPIPVVYGRVRLQAPNTIWYGHFGSTAITEEVKTGWFSEETVTKGHNYYVGFHFALCSGPGVKLKRIWIEKKAVYFSTLGVGDGGSGTINRGSLFGGRNKGGGFVGTFYWYTGEDTPVGRDAYMVARLGADFPAMPGTCHVVFRRPYIGTSAQLRPMSFEVERYPDNLGLDGLGIQIIGDDLNPMEVLYSALVEEWNGLGVDPSDIDTTSFHNVAQTLYDEQNGMSIAVQSTNTGKDIIEEVLRQVDGILYQDPVTGKLVVALIREDYVVGNLPVFDESNIEEVENFTRTSWAETMNQVRVKFSWRTKKYEEAAALSQDMANIHIQGRVRSTTVSFPGVTVPGLAVALSARELSQVSVPLFRATIRANRQAAQLRPGSPFVLNWSEYGLSQVVMRVQRFDLGELVQGKVVMECLQDRFAAANALFTSEDTLWNPIERDAVEIEDYNIFETPYWVIQQINNFTPPEDSGWIWALCRSPEFMIRYDFVTSNDNFQNNLVVDPNYQRYTESAKLVTAIPFNQGLPSGRIDKIIVEDPLPPAVTGYRYWGFGSSVIFRDINGDQNNIRNEGQGLIVINGEIFAYEDFNSLGGEPEQFELLNIHRALLDTTFEDHVAGDTVFLLNSIDWLCADAKPDVGTQWWKALSFSDEDGQDFDDPDVAAGTIVLNRRYKRPLPPDLIQVGDGSNEGRAPFEVIGVNDIEWTEANERNRTSPDQVVLLGDSGDQTETSPDTTYNLRMTLDGWELDEVTAIASWEPGPAPNPIATLTGLEGHGVAVIEVESYRDSPFSVASHTKDFFEFFYASYQNLSVEQLSNGDFEGAFPGSWSVQDGSWDDEQTDYPLDPVRVLGSMFDQDHAETQGSGNHELRQDWTIGARSGKQALVSVYKGNLVDGITGQLEVELRDGGGALDTITTPLEASPYAKWDRLEIPLPLRTDATIVRVKLIASDAGVAFDNASLKYHDPSPTTAAKYDSFTGTTVEGAWGLRKMVSTYAGALVRIRDTFDDSEQDVGADPDGNLAPFFVKGQARVVRLYDQSGNGANLEPSVVGDQPRLYYNMSPTGRAYIRFNSQGANDEALQDTIAGTTRPYMIARPNFFLVMGGQRDSTNDYIVAVPHVDGSHSSPYARWNLGTNPDDWHYRVDSVNNVYDGAAGNGSPEGGLHVLFIDHSNGDLYHNDDTVAADTFTAADTTYPNSTRLVIGETGNQSLEWTGDFYELAVISGSVGVSDRQTMMTDLGAYWLDETI